MITGGGQVNQSIRSALVVLAASGLLVGIVVGLPSARGDTPELLDQSRRLSARVSLIRQLPWRRPLCQRLASAEELQARVVRRVRSQYRPREIFSEGQLLALLGVLDRGDRYEEQVLRLVGENLTGYYDVEQECLFVRHEPGESFNEDHQQALAHELTHALQDQHFDLRQFLRHVPGDFDRLQAAAALVEGDATAVSLAVTGQGGLATAFREGPAALRRSFQNPDWFRNQGALGDFLRRSLELSYVGGLELVSSVFGVGGWAAVNELYRRSVLSTENVLHPVLPWRDESPGRVTLPPAPFGPTVRLPDRPVHDDSLGEFLLRASLARWLGQARAVTATSGWGGGRAWLYEECSPRQQHCLVAATWWDAEGIDEADGARRFAQAWTAALTRRYGSHARQLGELSVVVRGTTCAGLRRQGRRVWLFDGLSCHILNGEPSTRRSDEVSLPARP